MASYSNTLKVKDALALYFSKYHFANGGYTKKWFTIKLGPFFIPLPNIKDRVDAVKIHDIHHLITEYNADYKGEAEIGAWEIASGCDKYYVAWILNLSSMMIGILFYPSSLLKAFLRGRKCFTNLYHKIIYNDQLLSKNVGELRALIEQKMPSSNSIVDYTMFVFWCMIAFTYHLAIIAALCLTIQSLINLFS